MAELSKNQLDSVFGQFLGRQATDAEFNFLRNFVEKDELSEFEVGEIVQGLPEAQQRRFQSDISQAREILGASDQDLLTDAQDFIQSQFAKQGRSGSSGRLAAFANAARDLAIERQRQLAQFALPQLQGMSQGVGQQALGSRQRGFDIRQDRLNRARQLEDFDIQQKSVQGLLRQQGIQNMQQGLMNAGIGLGSTALKGGLGAGFGSLTGLGAGKGLMAGLGGFGGGK